MHLYTMEVKTENGMIREEVRAANTTDAMIELARMIQRKSNKTGVYHRVVSFTILKVD